MTTTAEVRLTDLLEHCVDGRVWLPDIARLRAQCEVEDLLLYTAYRGVQWRQVDSGDAAPTLWRGDEVHYAAGRLADGQPVRSIGHWNPPGQVEIFQVRSGRVLIMVATPHAPENLNIAEYGAGDICVVPAEAFHLTYSPWTPSVVFNIYSSGGGAWPQPDPGHKYQGNAAPAHTVTVSPARVVVGPPPTRLDHLRLTLPDLALPADLISLLSAGTDDDLRAVQKRFAHASFPWDWST